MSSDTPVNSAKPPRLLEQLRDRLRVKHYSIRTEAQYTQWVRRFIFFMTKSPSKAEGKEVGVFLTSLAVKRNGATTQNQALSACCFCIGKCCSPLDEV